jgi:hypothetical protein
MGEPVNDPGAPAFRSLPGQDIPSDGPVEQDQLAADGEGGANLSVLDTALQLLQQFGVSGWGAGVFCCFANYVGSSAHLVKKILKSLGVARFTFSCWKWNPATAQAS